METYWPKISASEQKTICLIINALTEIGATVRCQEVDSVLFDTYYQFREMRDLLSAIIFEWRVKRATCVTALALLDKIQAQYLYVLADEHIYKSVSGAFLLAIKFDNDFCPKNSDFAKSIELEPKEMNEIEVKLLSLVNYNTWIKDDLYQKYEEALSFTVNNN